MSPDTRCYEGMHFWRMKKDVRAQMAAADDGLNQILPVVLFTCLILNSTSWQRLFLISALHQCQCSGLHHTVWKLVAQP